MKSWFWRRTPEPPAFSFEPLLAEMRADAPMSTTPTPLAVQYSELQWRTMIAEQRGLLEQATAELEAQRARTGPVSSRSHPAQNARPGKDQEPVQTTSVAGRASTPDPNRTDDDLLAQLRAIRDRDDPDHPSGVMPTQAKVRDEVRVAFRRLRPLLHRLTIEDDELRARRGA